MQAGLRYEYTQTDINTLAGVSLVHRRYGNWFPSVFISRKLSKDYMINFSYSKRITRPSFNDIAPWVEFIDRIPTRRVIRCYALLCLMVSRAVTRIRIGTFSR